MVFIGVGAIIIGGGNHILVPGESVPRINVIVPGIHAEENGLCPNRRVKVAVARGRGDLGHTRYSSVTQPRRFNLSTPQTKLAVRNVILLESRRRDRNGRRAGSWTCCWAHA